MKVRADQMSRARRRRLEKKSARYESALQASNKDREKCTSVYTSATSSQSAQDSCTLVSTRTREDAVKSTHLPLVVLGL